ncbi:MAG: type II toxin-antitoxin system PemK/MazF family toxin [Caldilineaceae bacterium]
MRRGEVRWYTFRAPDKRRPVLLLTRNSAISYLTGITVAQITSTIRDVESEVLLTPAEDGVNNLCVVTLDNIQTIQKNQIGALITSLSPVRMQEVEQALCFALGVNRFLDM